MRAIHDRPGFLGIGASIARIARDACPAIRRPPLVIAFGRIQERLVRVAFRTSGCSHGVNKRNYDEGGCSYDNDDGDDKPHARILLEVVLLALLFERSR